MADRQDMTYKRVPVLTHERCRAVTQFSGGKDQCANRAKRDGLCGHHLKKEKRRG